MDIDTAQKTRSASARRRLLRGAFAAPAALTLYSGRAIAAASNLHCVFNQQQDPISPVPAVALTNETYVRIGLYKRTANDNYFVRGTDLQGFAISGSFTGLPTATQVRRFSITGNAFDDAARTIPMDLATNATRWAVLRIDGTGTVIGIGASGVTGGSAIYQSCWTSFKVGGP